MGRTTEDGELFRLAPPAEIGDKRAGDCVELVFEALQGTATGFRRGWLEHRTQPLVAGECRIGGQLDSEKCLVTAEFPATRLDATFLVLNNERQTEEHDVGGVGIHLEGRAPGLTATERRRNRKR